MILWRISNYADLKGTGGLRASGRWHFAGQPVVYLAEHPALALLEVIVHLELGNSDQLPSTFQLLGVEVDDAITIATIQDGDTPEDWRSDRAWTQGAGTEWLGAATSALLKVPSSIVPHSSNFLLNPAHADAARLKIIETTPVRYDSRILKLLSRT
jgi:RES domain-containing protein